MKRTVLARGRAPEKAIQMEDDSQVRDWMRRLSVSRHALDLAVQAAGGDPVEVERFVHLAKGRCSRAAKARRFPPAAASVRPLDGGGVQTAFEGAGTPQFLQHLLYCLQAAPAGETVAESPSEVSARLLPDAAS